MTLFLTLIISIQSQLTEVRNTYVKAIENSAYADKLVKLTKSESSSVNIAYYATGVALQAKHSWNPATKLSKAKMASKLYNKAIKSNCTNVESRFLRFSFEYNVPSVVGINKHLHEDKIYILAHLTSKNPIWSTIKPFLLNCDQLSSSEKNKVKLVQ